MWKPNWLYCISHASSPSDVGAAPRRSRQTALLWSDGRCSSGDTTHPPSLGQPSQLSLTWVLWCWFLESQNSQLPKQWCADMDKEIQPGLFSSGLQFSITSPYTAGRKYLVSENSQEIPFLFRFSWWFNSACSLWKVLNIQMCIGVGGVCRGKKEWCSLGRLWGVVTRALHCNWSPSVKGLKCRVEQFWLL